MSLLVRSYINGFPDIGKKDRNLEKTQFDSKPKTEWLKKLKIPFSN